MESRLSLIWLALFGVIESTDALTTELDRARGSIESMPVSASMLNEGGLYLFVTIKVLLVAAAAAALLLALRWLRFNRWRARTLFMYVLMAVRLATVALAVASLNNALLLRSLG